MPDSDLDALFGEVEAELSADTDTETDVQVDNPDVESTDVDDGEPDIDEQVDVDTDDDDNPEDDGIDADHEDGSVWNWEEYSDQLVPWERGDETGQVTLKELRDGYMRQQDYTAKTQEIAEARRAAQWANDMLAALDRDPQGTIQAIAQAYGITEAQAEQATRQSLDDLDEDIRPWAEAATRAEQYAQQMEQRLQQLEDERIKSEIRFELDSLANQFGESFNKVEVLQTAAQKNLNLEDAYWYLQGQRSFQQRQNDSQANAAAQQAADAQRQAAEAKRRQAKKQASSSSTKSFKASDIPADDFNDIGELFEQIAASSGS